MDLEVYPVAVYGDVGVGPSCLPSTRTVWYDISSMKERLPETNPDGFRVGMRRKEGKVETRGTVPEEDKGDVFYKSTVPLANLASKGTILFNFKGTTSLDGILAIGDVSRNFGLRISARWARADYHGVKHGPEPGFDHLAAFSGRPDLGEFLWKDQFNPPADVKSRTWRDALTTRPQAIFRRNGMTGEADGQDEPLWFELRPWVRIPPGEWQDITANRAAYYQALEMQSSPRYAITGRLANGENFPLPDRDQGPWRATFDFPDRKVNKVGFRLCGDLLEKGLYFGASVTDSLNGKGNTVRVEARFAPEYLRALIREKPPTPCGRKLMEEI